VVSAASGRALYFSRSTIPCYRDRKPGEIPEYRKHLGLYAYRKAALLRFAQLPPSRLETIERLEQLRMLENDMAVYVEHTPFDTIGVDTEEDLNAAERILRGEIAR
jgi:3-deoxy-manno-octulosonate cytidylyltransferase (CMP-KDO synthetase)